MRFSEEALKALRERYTYDACTGIFTSIKTGKQVTYTSSNGYIQIHISVNGKKVMWSGHHVAWYLTYGVWPTEIDHRNRNRADNRIENLREVSRSINLRNRSVRADIQSVHAYVAWDTRRNKWSARLPRSVDKKRPFIGYFDCEHEANAALQAAMIKPSL